MWEQIVQTNSLWLHCLTILNRKIQEELAVLYFSLISLTAVAVLEQSKKKHQTKHKQVINEEQC